MGGAENSQSRNGTNGEVMVFEPIRIRCQNEMAALGLGTDSKSQDQAVGRRLGGGPEKVRTRRPEASGNVIEEMHGVAGTQGQDISCGVNGKGYGDGLGLGTWSRRPAPRWPLHSDYGYK